MTLQGSAEKLSSDGLKNQTPRNIWSLDGFSVVELLADKAHSLTVAEGPDHAVLLGIGRRCHLRCDMGGRWLSGDGGPGQLFVVPPRTSGLFHWAGPQTSCVFYLSDPFLETAVSAVSGRGDRPFRLQSIAFKHDPVIQTILTPLIAEIKGTGRGREMLVSALGRILAVQLVRRYSATTENRTAPQLSPHRLATVLRYIEENCCRQIPLNTLADLTQLSPHYFLRLFKESTGVTPHHYLLRKRVEKAKRMLVEANKSMAEVALEAGFPSQSHFGTIFKKISGYTPKAWLHSDEAVQEAGARIGRGSGASRTTLPNASPAST